MLVNTILSPFVDKNCELIIVGPIWFRDKNFVFKNNVIVGIHYRSTQKATDGIGNRTEYFTNGGGEVKKNMTYFVRLNNSES